MGDYAPLMVKKALTRTHDMGNMQDGMMECWNDGMME
jgi:hypothetical protein